MGLAKEHMNITHRQQRGYGQREGGRDRGEVNEVCVQGYGDICNNVNNKNKEKKKKKTFYSSDGQ